MGRRRKAFDDEPISEQMSDEEYRQLVKNTMTQILESQYSTDAQKRKAQKELNAIKAEEEKWKKK